MAGGMGRNGNDYFSRMALKQGDRTMNPNHKRGMEVVDSVNRRELDRSLQASQQRRKTEKEKAESQAASSESKPAKK